MEKVRLALGRNSYDIFIGPGLLSDADLIGRYIEKKSAFIISNKSVADYYLDQLLLSLSAFDCGVYLLPEGEQFKNLRTVEEIIGVMIKKGDKVSGSIFIKVINNRNYSNIFGRVFLNDSTQWTLMAEGYEKEISEETIT